MADSMNVDICVIGAGSGGLSVAAGAVQMGASVALVERHKMGGDCLNYGCVPSKALLAAAHEAAAHRGSGHFGVGDHEPAVDFSRVNAHVQGVIGAIAPHDSVERFEELGVTVLQGAAQFTGRREIEVNGQKVRAKWFVISTGSRATAPPVPGLDETPFLTNETVFDLTDAPAHLIVIGGGPIGIEMAQAHRRLGCKVTVLEMFGIMGKDDPDLVQVVRNRLIEEGVDIREGVKIEKVAGVVGNVSAIIEDKGQTEQINGSHLLVAAGRAPVMDGLNLEAAGVAFDKKGITVDKGLRTSNKRVFAIGDVAGGPQFTHVAGYHAGIIIRRILFRMFWAKTDYRALPWVTYTDPELALVGMPEVEARKRYNDVRTVSWPFEENDRAQAERRTEGIIKVVARKKGRVLGASIVGPHAGELILPWVMAVQHKMKIGAMTAIIAPYPTLGEVSKRVAGAWYTPSLFSEKTRKIVRFLMRFA
jgi:pyruvate/2-oxoglutarate dehydrogenase complex dihydrolipoamide dehydrogenase (E3) component